jgi:hypothetical protein
VLAQDVPGIHEVLGGNPLGNDHPPRLDDDLAHLGVIDGIQSSQYPVVSKVGGLGHHELVGL